MEVEIESKSSSACPKASNIAAIFIVKRIGMVSLY